MTSPLDTLPDPSELRALLSSALALPGARRQRSRLERLADDYARGKDHTQGALVVALVGATGAGKSTLLNALAGMTLAEEGTQRPTSDRATLYAPDDADVGKLAALGASVVRYHPRADAPWSGHVFVDTPDVNSVATRHRDIAAAVVEQADVLVSVLHKGAVAEAAQAEFLLPFARRRALLFVLNFADELGPVARTTLCQQVREVASSTLGLPAEQTDVFAVSALAARRGEDPSGEWPALLDALRTLGRAANVEKVRRSNAMGALRELNEVLRPAVVEAESTQGAVEGALEQGFGAARGAVVEDFEERLSLSGGHLKQAIRRAASERWWGPAAWWMRASAFGTGGMGAAALVARHNLPVGLAVAAASTVVDRVREHTLASSADKRIVRSDGPALEAAVQAALAGARTAALQHGETPAGMGLAEPAAVLEALSDARASAWSYAETEALAATIRNWWRWSRWLLLPLINLPLLALAGHVAYRVVRAYVEGPYLGLDYFLNTGALAVLLSLAGALLGSLSLAGTARKVQRLALTRFEAQVARVGGGLGEAVRASNGPALAAARSLLSWTEQPTRLLPR